MKERPVLRSSVQQDRHNTAPNGQRLKYRGVTYDSHVRCIGFIYVDDVKWRHAADMVA